MDLAADEVFELKLIFLREMGSGYASAREAHARLKKDPADASALQDLRDFFHRIAGTAETVDHALLGLLAAACETVAAAVAEGAMQPGRRAIQVFADGLAGVAQVIEVLPGHSAPLQRHFPETTEALARQAAQEVAPSRILVIDDDPFSARLVDSVLRAAGFVSSFCCEADKAFETIQQESPDLIILDVVMPQMDGFDICRRVRAHPGLQLTPIIFVTRQGDVEQRVRGLQVGGNDYVAKPFEPQELVARVRSHLQRLHELREMAIRDGLTRCYNNKYFKLRIEQELTRARRYGAELTLGMLDIDHFKRVNDTFGYPAGDAVLAHLASLLTASVRSSDVVARFGGEEFGFLLIESAVPESAIITNRLRERIAKHEFHIPSLSGSDLVISCTVSIGLANFIPGDSPQQLLARADAALLAAKQGGRNQVRIGA